MENTQNMTLSSGLVAKINKNWEKRYEDLINEDCFSVNILLNFALTDNLTEDEIERLQTKLYEIEIFANKLSVAMLKGTLKYPSDTRTVEEWAAFEQDEFFDLVNYRLLLKSAQA